MPVNATNEKLGWSAPSFKLKDVCGDFKSLDNLKGKNGTVIAFICNHCPYVTAIAERLSLEAKELDAQIRKLGFVSVSYNPFNRSIQIIDGFNDGGNTIYLKDIADAKKRCNLSESFVIHTAGSMHL